jgi:hypothetical protein
MQIHFSETAMGETSHHLQMLTLLPALATVGFLGFALSLMFRKETGPKNLWLLPAALSLLFALFSLDAVLSEGTLGFWTEHTRNLWGNQIWFDLLLSIGIGWASLLPQAQALKMRPAPWLLFIVCTGSVGLLAMLARVLYLRQRENARGEFEWADPSSPSDPAAQRQSARIPS